MTSSSIDDADKDAVTDKGSNPIEPLAGLRGRLGVLGVVSAVLAFTAPLGGVAGYVALIIASGNGLGAPATFVAVGILILLFSIGYTRMTQLVPTAGGFYAYVSVGLGRAVGLGTGLLTTTGYLVGGFGFCVFGGMVASSTIQARLAGAAVPWWAYTLGFIGVVTALSYRRIDASVRVMTVVMAVEVGIVAVFDLFVGLRGGPTGRSLESFTTHAALSGSPTIAALFAFLLFVGFEVTTLFREEVKDPARTIRRSTYLSVGFIAAFYALSAWCMITAFGTEEAVSRAQEDPAGMFFGGVDRYLGPTATTIASYLLITSVFACQLSYANTVCRYLYSMGHDGVLPKVLGRAHSHHGSPHRAAMVLGVVSAGLTLAVAGCQLSPTDVFTWALFVAGIPLLAGYVLVGASIFVHFVRNRSHDLVTGRLLFSSGLALAGLAGILVLALANPSALAGRDSILNYVVPAALLSVLIGGVGYGFVLRIRRPQVYRRIGRRLG
ncbi:APC family permease [Nocardia tengchongensis]|uniref:APC family permease n=1 Tax=Nocardia tengchongensis TaxID=2055889 RepID=UPI0036818E54